MNGYRTDAIRALSLDMIGKWAIHPSQIAPALDVFSPTYDEVAYARKLETAFREADREGLGAAQVDGEMVDLATVRLLRVTLDRAALYQL